jgi:hypothetical protein
MERRSRHVVGTGGRSVERIVKGSITFAIVAWTPERKLCLLQVAFPTCNGFVAYPNTIAPFLVDARRRPHVKKITTKTIGGGGVLSLISSQTFSRRSANAQCHDCDPVGSTALASSAALAQMQNQQRPSAPGAAAPNATGTPITVGERRRLRSLSLRSP